MYEVLNLKSEVGSRKSEVWSWKSEVRRRKTPLGFRNLRSGSIFVSLCNNIPAGKAKRNLAVAVRKNVRGTAKIGPDLMRLWPSFYPVFSPPTTSARHRLGLCGYVIHFRHSALKHLTSTLEAINNDFPIFWHYISENYGEENFSSCC